MSFLGPKGPFSGAKLAGFVSGEGKQNSGYLVYVGDQKLPSYIYGDNRMRL